MKDEPNDITELRRRVAKANELSGGFDNRGNHVLGAFLTGVLLEYDKVVNENIVLKGDVKEWKLMWEDAREALSHYQHALDDIATALGYRTGQTYDMQSLLKKIERLQK